MNTLVTGHSGFLGDHTARLFKKMGHKVYGMSRSIKESCQYPQFSLDITNKNKLTQIVSEKCIDQIIHIAGKPLVADCDKDPFNAYLVNGLGTASVLESARLANCTKVVVIETDKVYGYQGEVPTKEDAILNPGSPYELSKALGAQFCNFYRQQYDMDIISVRPANLFGPGDFSYTRIIPASINNILNGKGIPIHGNGETIYRDFLYVEDAAKMIFTLSSRDTKHKIYNLSCNNSISIAKLASNITQALNHKVKPFFVEKPGNYKEIPYQSIDGSRFVEEFNFKFTPFEEAIRDTFKAYKRHLD